MLFNLGVFNYLLLFSSSRDEVSMTEFTEYRDYFLSNIKVK